MDKKPTSGKRDFSQIAFSVFQQAIGEEEKPAPLTPRQQASSEGGKIGGKARAEALTPERRKEISEQAAAARWNK